MLYAALPLYQVGVLDKGRISVEYRKTMKKVLRLPPGVSTSDLNNILFEADLGELVEVVEEGRKLQWDKITTKDRI